MADINGTPQDDELFGAADADIINGDAGNDIIRGNSGADQVNGGDGNDQIFGDGDNDQLSGGDGDDGFFGGGGDDVINGDAGNDSLFGDGGADELFGGEGDDVLNGGAHNDTLNGGSGNDTLDGGSGVNVLNGGADDDTLIHSFGTSTSTIDGGTGNDTLVLTFNSADITAAVQADVDVLNQWFIDNQTAGTAGTPLTVSGLGLTVSNVANLVIKVDNVVTPVDDFLQQTPPEEVVVEPEVELPVEETTNEINGTSGDDEITGTSGKDVINAGAGKDVVVGLEGDDVIYGEDGNDRLYGDAGDDVVYGGEGNDTLVGHSGNDQLFGGEGNDGFFGGGNNDIIWGENGNDHIFGDGGDDVIYGGADDDRLIGGSGNDTLDGGTGVNDLDGSSGDDTLIHSYLTSTTTINGGGGFDTVRVVFGSDILSPAARADLETLNQWFEDGLNVNGAQLVLTELGVTIMNVEEVEITVGGVVTPIEEFLNQAPEVAADVSHDTDEDVSVSGQVVATDADGDVLTCTVAQGPVNGVLVLDEDTGVYTYTPNQDFSGDDVFDVVVTDPSGATATQRVTVRTEAVADQPVLTVEQTAVATGASIITGTNGNDDLYDSVKVTMTAELDISAALADIGGTESLSITISDLPTGATLSAGTVNQDGSVTLTPEELEGLTVTNPNSEVDFTLAVTATSTEENGSTATTTAAVNVEVSDTSLNADVLYGLGGNDRMYAGRGNDVFYDGDGNDYASGGNDDDIFVAGAGNDRYVGGSGFDTIDFSQATGAVSVDIGSGRASGHGKDKFSQIEGVVGSDFDDDLEGGKGNDVLSGGAGNDTIVGDRGSDMLTGGEGEDTYSWSRSHVKNSTLDVITDFAVGEDTLDFSRLGRGSRDAVIELTETADGTVVSYQDRPGQAFRDVVLLQDVFDLEEPTPGSGDDWLIT